ncbi:MULTISPECIES: UDP-N-acetylmuramoyl-L-alanyl-D-glutamate--2,6-diaminopimelate ligase [Terrabacteria group]|uniref:UDP-N-acetylmuramoyl-L-alanyl-D-glutamate--2, 6-diaminopimelate ligase n=1 Tax=Bacillati TaxID=1783272 RepID=UPI001C6E3CBC|nr:MULTISPECIES: UDP-N-acetylmuramoyl-L-alanyl-D-glutamate--2,6-diaminopimelate ligase [Terrabacteria group]MBW9212078.1 UDP-N-acetylmuramoyl-L-alanyl-D-glutamate--2,6-diaminopimelate ligase [Trueperella sp. zg.1013]
MKLVDLLDLNYQLYRTIKGSIQDINIEYLSQDSRDIQKNTLFFCVPGASFDGHQFAKIAEEKGAVCLIASKPVDVQIPIIYVEDVVRTMAFLAMRFYHNPSKEITLIGVTGTNGKTTTTHIIRHLFEKNKQVCGMIGTNGIWYQQEHIYSPNTTPDALTLQKSLAKMKKAGVSFCTAEVSSHALVMGRVQHVDFKVAVFTNLTHEHLETHHTMSEYCMAKSLLFAQLGSGNDKKVAILNKDDAYAKEIANRCNAMIWYYSTKDSSAEFYAKDIQYSATSTSFILVFQGREYLIQSGLIGEFNVQNVLAALATYYAVHRNLELAIEALKSFKGVEGRMQRVENSLGIHAIVDFAHTPDGLEKAMTALKEIEHTRIITMIGHDGGNRDNSIRQDLGRIALEHSDYVVFTSENPRDENPMKIMNEMVKGSDKKNYEFLVDRHEAIDQVVSLAKRGDILFFAGKGHEPYQLIKRERIPFNEVQFVKEALEKKAHE